MPPPVLTGGASPPSCREIFLGYAFIGAVGFGGVMPWMRWLLVERKAWYSEAGFSEAFAMAQVIPGGNVVALAAMSGAQLAGWRGAVAALSGLTLIPAVLVCVAGKLYLDYRHLPMVQSILAAVSVAGAGLILGMALRMMRPLSRRWQSVLVMGLVVGTELSLQLPLWMVLLIFSPLSLLLMRWRKDA